MERFFILDKFNTWYDWRCVLTSKVIDDPELKTNYVNIDGMSGALDLSESLTGEITYNDRNISASFWTDEGTFEDRNRLLHKITSILHGKKIKIIEPDDSEHYFIGRVKITDKTNILPYAEFKLEATCEPWRYSVNEITRHFNINSDDVTNLILINNGVKTLSPELTVIGDITFVYENTTVTLKTGTYKISNLKLRQGVNNVGVSGNGSIVFNYREATI